MAKLMDVSDQDVAVIEDTIKERLELGVSQAQAQRQAVDEALAQLADERAMVMAAVDEQLGAQNQVAESTPDDYTSQDEIPTDEGIAESAKPTDLGVRRDTQRAPKVFDTSAPEGDYYVRSIVGTETKRALGARSIKSFADVAAATAYLYRSAVERLDGVVTDAKGTPLAVVGGFKGAITQASVYPATIVAEAVRVPGAAQIWFSHNHPSGNPTLSNADRRLEETLRNVFAGSGIEPMGLIAVGRGRFSATDGTAGDIQPTGKTKNVPVVERELVDDGGARDTISSPDAAKSLARTYYGQANTPGLMLLDAQNSVIGWMPLPETFTGRLRYTGGLNALYRAASEANAAAVIAVHGGELDAPVGNVSAAENIMAGLQAVDVRALDTVNVKTGRSVAEQGLPVAKGPVFANKRQTETPAFKAWFAGSKVVDSNGDPLVVYHGTTKSFDAFSNGTGWFTSDAGEANFWGGVNSEGANVVPAYLSLKNPRILQAADASRNRIIDALEALQNDEDGVIVMEDGKIRWAVASDPTQIKSAIGNNGNFDGTNPDIRFANKSQSKWVDATGRWQFGPGQMAFDLLGKAAGPLLDRIYLRSASTEVRHTIRKMKLDVQKAMETTTEMVGAMRAMSADERSMISDIIEGELKANVTPGASAVQHAAMMNEAFENQTNELVRLGMLTQEAADRWRGKYLPRYYESKLNGTVSDAWADLFKIVRKGDTLKGIKGRHLRGRGMTMGILVSDLAEYEAKGWEVRDNNFDPAVDKEVYIWRDFTKKEREDMGEIRDAGFRFTMGYMQTQKDIALGRMYEGISLNPEMSSRVQRDGFVQVPDTKVPETQAKRYGKLAGMWVSRNMMSQLSLQQEMESDALKLYRKALSIWKESRTVLNPVSHMNNFVSNLTMAHLAGVSYGRGDKYAGAIKDFASGAPMIKEAHDAGLFLGSMSEEELGKLLPLELQTLLSKQDSKGISALKWGHTLLTWGLRRPAGVAYEFGDRFFKYLIYKDARARGMEPNDAVDYAQKFIFTYDGLPQGARMIRDFAIPFFSYSYKAIPVLAEMALTHPHRMVAPAGILSVASVAAYALAASGDDDDWMDVVKKYITDEEFRKKADDKRAEEYKLLPDWMKGRTSFFTPKAIRLGTDEATNNPVFLDTSRFIPGGDLFDVTGNSGGMPFIQPLTPSNPLLSTYMAMIGNKDFFTGKEIVNKDTDTDVEAGLKRADWMWKMATPAIAINQAHWDRMINAVAHANGDEELPIPDLVGGNLTGIGKDGMPVQAKYAAMNTFGIKARPMDLDMSEQIQKSVQRKTLAELDAQLRQARMQNAKGVRSDRNYEKVVEQIRLKKDRLKEGLTVDGDERP